MQALAWAPLVVLALLRAAQGGRREVAWAAAATAVLVSTTALEFALQACAVGAVLALPSASRRGAARVACALLLSIGLASFVIAPLSALVAGSARGAGFPTDVVLAHSVHPVALLQLVVAGLFGDPARVSEAWWGTNFFPRGFPYVLSLYCGASGLALAAAGALERRPRTRRLVVLAAAALLVCVGQWAGLARVVEAFPPLRTLRFPVKAFLTVQLSVALLAAFALDGVARAQRATLARLGWFAGLAGLGLAVAPFAALQHPAAAQFVLGGFFPPEMPWVLRFAHAREIASDAAVGGALAVVCAALALLGCAGRLRPAACAATIGLVLAADLLRAGAGLNPMASVAEVAPSREAAALGARLRALGGRVYPLDPAYGTAYFAARAQRGETHELWSFAVLQDTFAPDTNLRSGIPTALTPDRTMLVPAERTTPPELAGPGGVLALLPSLRAAGVSHVVSVDPLQGPGLVPDQAIVPARLWPLAVHVYGVADARPLAEVVPDPGGSGRLLAQERRGDRVEIDVETGGSARLLLREALQHGWTARVDGLETALEPVGTHHVSLRLGAGRHRVRLDYEPPLLRAGAALSGVSLLLTLWLGLGGGAAGRPREARA